MLTDLPKKTARAIVNVSETGRALGDNGNVPEAEFGEALAAFPPRLEDRDLDHDHAVRALLRQAGEGPVIQHVQDSFCHRVYWAPALRSAAIVGADTALGLETD